MDRLIDEGLANRSSPEDPSKMVIGAGEGNVSEVGGGGNKDQREYEVPVGRGVSTITLNNQLLGNLGIVEVLVQVVHAQARGTHGRMARRGVYTRTANARATRALKALKAGSLSVFLTLEIVNYVT
ncbi:hypothetical protein FRC11_005322 [Ceratobasidium sp. 423]|nr:hypothetical protein FRC11_005322 [Ceratobasidium sp. 423]